MSLNLANSPHRRYNILTGEWVLVSPHRTQRPWQGKTEQAQEGNRPAYDPNCYLCAGNARAGGQQTPVYTGTYVFTNDFSALMPQSETGRYDRGLLHAAGEQGVCRVICFSPNHAATLADMETDAIEQVVDVWQEEYAALGALPFINHVQIFENKGAIMGCSNPHPHGQVWAQQSIPQEALKKGTRQAAYWKDHGASLLGAYLDQELDLQERLVTSNADFVVLVPFWAVWPFETMIIPRRHMQHIGQLTPGEKRNFAAVIKDLTMRYDALFQTSFPYSSGIHQSPTDGGPHPEWHFHMSFYPPLLRSATVKKFMVGYEMFADPQRDLTAEAAADMLRRT